MTFAAVVRSELADGIADQIRDAILSGEYAPGDALPSERVLTQQFGVNRTTIREGLAQLEHQGLVERRQGARCRVLDYRRTGSIELLPDLIRLPHPRQAHGDPSPLASTNEVLRIIYEGALDLLFERITAAEITQLDALARDLEHAAATADATAVAHANRAFHQGVARATHSIALELLVGSFYRVVDAASARARDQRGAVGHALVELQRRGVRLPQRALADAIAAGDAHEAHGVVRRMLGDGAREPAATSTP
ncbi:MAG TPA: GntR family transcriptional regulator [Acidimicrobiia bacterium]|nr:GntR family transcriptional regulator [Acidimicrobiia bacterium]